MLQLENGKGFQSTLRKMCFKVKWSHVFTADKICQFLFNLLDAFCAVKIVLFCAIHLYLLSDANLLEFIVEMKLHKPKFMLCWIGAVSLLFSMTQLVFLAFLK